YIGLDRVAVLQAVETAARLYRAVEVGRRKHETWQAERIGRVGLLRRNHAAARPLVAARRAGEGYGAHDAVAIHARRPPIEIESTVGLPTRRLQRRLHRGVRGEVFAWIRVIVTIGGHERGGQTDESN